MAGGGRRRLEEDESEDKDEDGEGTRVADRLKELETDGISAITRLES